MCDGLALSNEMYFRVFAPLTGTLLAEREAEAGRVEIGLTTLDAQLAAIEQTGQRWFDSEVYRVRGELLLKLQQPDVAAAESAFMPCHRDRPQPTDANVRVARCTVTCKAL
jgi:hypothetical protein